jgi:hypothetical protein
MAEQVEVGRVSSIPYGVLALSLSDAICALGIPSLEMGLAAANAGLVKLDTGEGTMHFEWDKAALDRHPPIFLENLLTNLRDAVGVQ